MGAQVVQGELAGSCSLPAVGGEGKPVKQGRGGDMLKESGSAGGMDIKVLLGIHLVQGTCRCPRHWMAPQYKRKPLGYCSASSSSWPPSHSEEHQGFPDLLVLLSRLPRRCSLGRGVYQGLSPSIRQTTANQEGEQG